MGVWIDTIETNLFFLSSVTMSFSKSVKKIIDDAENSNSFDVDLCERGLLDIAEYISPLSRVLHLSRLTLSHNKLTNLPSTISELKGLESLNLFNNHLESLPQSLNDLQVSSR